MSGRILIATDLSARSDRALKRALLLGRELGVPLTILHVIEGGRQLDNLQEDQLRALLRHEFDLQDQAVEICFAYGPVPSTIARFAEERGCSVIVTGVARFNHLKDFILGTAVDYLIRQSPCPVLIVKRRAHQSYERLVVATDFSPASARALDAAVTIFPNASVRLVHAYEAAFEGFLDHDTTAPFIRDEAKRKMKGVLANLPKALRSRVETVVEEGDAPTILSTNVSELGNDLLVLGTWHRRRHAHFMGSEDSWSLPATEPCDVLIVGKAVHESRELSQPTRSSQKVTG